MFTLDSTCTLLAIDIHAESSGPYQIYRYYSLKLIVLSADACRTQNEIRPCQYNYLFNGPDGPYVLKIANEFKWWLLPWWRSLHERFRMHNNYLWLLDYLMGNLGVIFFYWLYLYAATTGNGIIISWFLFTILPTYRPYSVPLNVRWTRN